jgi:acyl-CoA reductase-like NAD-dependent aldehyde dehydrogenase
MKLIEKLKYAFSIPKEEETVNDREKILLEKIASLIVERHMEVIAITFLESVKPLNFLASQAMLLLKPIVESLFPMEEKYKELQKILEKRGSIEYLIQAIEAQKRK